MWRTLEKLKLTHLPIPKSCVGQVATWVGKKFLRNWRTSFSTAVNQFCPMKNGEIQ